MMKMKPLLNGDDFNSDNSRVGSAGDYFLFVFVLSHL